MDERHEQSLLHALDILKKWYFAMVSKITYIEK